MKDNPNIVPPVKESPVKYRVHGHTHWEEIERRCGRCGGRLFQEVARDGTVYPYFSCDRLGCTWPDYHVDELMGREGMPVLSFPERYAVWLEDDLPPRQD